jgi:hypothetical protein
MKNMLLVTTLLMSSGFIFAAEPSSDHKDHHGDSAMTMTQRETDMSADNMPMMQEMHSQMMEINQTTDPDKRDELIQAHMVNMRKMMKMMQDMHGDSKAVMRHGMDMSDGMMDDKDKNMMAMMNRQRMMEKRMNMMQMMMDQMMLNQAASEETHTMRAKRHDHMKTK